MIEDPRLILSVRRAFQQDDEDLAIADALSRAREDATLRTWLQEQQQFDSALVLKLRQLQPPDGLRGSILAGVKIGRKSYRQWLGEWGSPRKREWIAVAAVFLIFAIALVSNIFTNTPKTWQQAAIAEAIKIESRSRQIDHLSGNIHEIKSWLSEQKLPVPYKLPQKIESLAVMGCSKLEWRGLNMSLIYLHLPGDKKAHLATIARGNLTYEPSFSPEFSEMDGYQTAAWSNGEVSMFIIGKIDALSLERLFQKDEALVFAQW